MKTFKRLCVALTAVGLAPASFAQDFPDRPIRMVIGYAPGGPTDVIGRIVAKGMSEALGKPIVIENKPGANAIIATRAVMNDKPDGYTILFSPIAYTINPLVNPNLAQYDSATAMAPVALVATLPLVLITAGSSPYNRAEDIVAAAKTKPETVSFASSGNGSSPHLAAAWLAADTGTSMLHVSFGGNAPAMTEVMSGRIDFMFYPMVGLSPFVKQGKLKALAVGTREPVAEFPGTPTVNDAVGVEGFEGTAPWVGILAPKGTPDAVVERLNKAARHALMQPDAQQKLAELGADVNLGSSQQFADFLLQEKEGWRELVNSAGIAPTEAK